MDRDAKETYPLHVRLAPDRPTDPLVAAFVAGIKSAHAIIQERRQALSVIEGGKPDDETVAQIYG
jgi:hypothetical protein